jgi:hypothetical protein
LNFIDVELADGAEQPARGDAIDGVERITAALCTPP